MGGPNPCSICRVEMWNSCRGGEQERDSATAHAAGPNRRSRPLSDLGASPQWWDGFPSLCPPPYSGSAGVAASGPMP